MLAKRFADAFEHDDREGLVSLLTEDAWPTMPPYPHAYQGPRTIGDFLRASATWRGARGYRLVQTRANMQPAFGCYRQDPDGPFASAAGLVVLTLEGDRLARITRFLDTRLFRYFGLPPTQIRR